MSRLSFANLRVRLLSLVLLAVVPALGLILYTNFEVRQMVVVDVREGALRLARLAATDQEDSIRDTRQLLFALAQLPQVRSDDSDTCSAFLAQLLRQYPQYIRLGVIAPDGKIFCSAYPLSSLMGVADQAYFQRVVQTHDFAMSDYQVDQISGKAILNFGYPILDEAGQIQAVIFAALDLSWLNQVATEAQLPAGSTFTVIDRNGTILVRYPDSAMWVGKSTPEAPIIELILSQQGEGTAEAAGIDGVLRLFAFTPLFGAPGGEDLYVSVGIPSPVAFADANRVLTRNLVGLGGVTILALGAAWFGGQWFILRWVRRLVETTKRLSAGDLSVRTGLPYRHGELGQLACAFDDMATSLEQHISERDQAEGALREAHQLLEQRVAERTRALSALYDVAAVASESLSLEMILNGSLKRVLSVMAVDTGTIHLFDETEGGLTLAACQGCVTDSPTQKEILSSANALVRQVFDQGVPLVIPELESRLGLESPIPDLTRSYIGVPMRAAGRALGVLSVVGKTGRRFNDEEVALLDSIADQVGVAVENGLLYQQAEHLAVMEERSRLARDLHDSVTQSLYSLTLYAEVGRRASEAGHTAGVFDYLTRMGQVAQQTLREMRLLVFELRPVALETDGLVGALQQRLDAVEKRAGIEIQFLAETMGDLPPLVEEGLYRIAQEALNNALKHAQASQVSVRLKASGEWVELEIADNGCGFDKNEVRYSPGLGLDNISERVQRLGGEFEIISKPGEGTKIRAKIKVKAPTQQSGSRPILPLNRFSEVMS